MVTEVPPPTDTPQEFAQTTPRDLHPTSDIRFVMTEVSRLSTLVERLIKDVETQSGKVDKLNNQATFIKGALFAGGVAVAVFGWFITWLVDGKLEKVLEALKAVQ